MIDEEKDKLVAYLISTEKGRAFIVNIAIKTNSMDKLGKAIKESIDKVVENK